MIGNYTPIGCLIVVALSQTLFIGRTTSLQYIAAKVGSSFNITCNLSHTNITWWEYVTKDGQETLLAENGNIIHGTMLHNVNISQDGETLLFQSAQKLHAGKYSCNESVSGKSQEAGVIVLEPLQCSDRPENLSLPDVVEGDVVTLSCNATYHGNLELEPYLVWSYGDNGTPINSSLEGDKTWTISKDYTITTQPSDDAATYTCDLGFNETPGVYDAAPQSCTVTLAVKYGPMNTNITPDGDSIHCHSAGNPPPRIQWHYGGEVNLTREPSWADLKESGVSYITCVASSVIREDAQVETYTHVFLPPQVVPEKDKDAAIVGGVLGAVILLLLVLIAVLSVERRGKKEAIDGELTRKERRGSEAQITNIAKEAKEARAVMRYSSLPGHGTHIGETNSGYQPSPTASSKSVRMSKWEVKRDNVTLGLTAGTGSFGVVYHAEMLGLDEHGGDQKVAVKTLKANHSRKDTSDLRMELETMKLLPEHENIVKLLGCCAVEDPLYIIMELMSGGTLRSYLVANRSSAQSAYGNLQTGSNLHESTLMEFAEQIGKGMAHLSHHKLIHRHLAAQYVLMTDDNVCKLSDFGLTREPLPHNSGPAVLSRFPVRWMAPENILSSSFSTEGDVWSFGILLWEIITMAARPYTGKTNSEVVIALTNYETMQQPAHCGDQLFAIMKKCWSKEPASRPSFVKLVEELHQLGSHGEQLYMDLIDEGLYADA